MPRWKLGVSTRSVHTPNFSALFKTLCERLARQRTVNLVARTAPLGRIRGMTRDLCQGRDLQAVPHAKQST